MHNAPSKWRNVPVELIVIGVVIAAGIVLARGGKDDVAAADAPPAEEQRSVEMTESIEEASIDAPAPEEEVEIARPVVETKALPAAVTPPAGFPPELISAGMTLTSASTDSATNEHVVTWKTSAEGIVASRAYAEMLGEKGWTVTSSADNPGSSVLEFERGNSRGWAAFVGSTPDVTVTLTLTLAAS